MKIVIIGGGIAGLTTAIALQQKGFDAMVYEAAPKLEPVGAGLGLAANALKALEMIGLADKVRSQSAKLNYFEIRDRKGKVISATTKADFRENLCIHRGVLHKILVDALGAHKIFLGKKALRVQKNENGTLIEFSDGGRCAADGFIIADGINSSVRSQLASGAKMRYAGYTCWRAIADNPGMNLTGAVEIWDPEGRFGYTPLPDGRIYWYACINAERGKQMSHFTLYDLQKHFSGYNEKVSLLLAGTKPDTLIYDDINDLQPLSKYAYGNIVLVGDAAHATTPNMGQGACQAIEDAVILAKCLDSAGAVCDAFSKFEVLRLERTHNVIKQSRRIGQLAQIENKMLIKIRNLVMKLYPKSMQQKQFSELFDVTF